MNMFVVMTKYYHEFKRIIKQTIFLRLSKNCLGITCFHQYTHLAHSGACAENFLFFLVSSAIAVGTMGIELGTVFIYTKTA